MIWVAVEDGKIAICNTNCDNQKICYVELNNFPDNAVDIIEICPIDEHTVVLGCANGVLVFVKHQNISYSGFLLFEVDIKLKKLQVINSIQCHSSIHDIELISDVQELWCGCNSGLIEIIDFSSSVLTNKRILNLQSESSDIHENSAVLQLKLASANVFCLHRGNVISCWVASQQSLLKVISPHLQG